MDFRRLLGLDDVDSDGSEDFDLRLRVRADSDDATLRFPASTPPSPFHDIVRSCPCPVCRQHPFRVDLHVFAPYALDSINRDDNYNSCTFKSIESHNQCVACVSNPSFPLLSLSPFTFSSIALLLPLIDSILLFRHLVRPHRLDSMNWTSVSLTVGPVRFIDLQ